MGASPTPMAFGEVYTVAADRRHRRLRARREHDAAAALLRSRALHGAHAAHRRRARPLGIDRRRWQRCRPTSAPRSSARRSKRPRAAARDGRRSRTRGDRAARERDDDPRDRATVRAPAAERLWEPRRAPRRRRVARGDPRVTSADAGSAGIAHPRRARPSTACSMVDRDPRRRAGRRRRPAGRRPASASASPIPWTEEIARLLLVWLMCVGGIAALRHGQHPRVTALVRLLSAIAPRRPSIAACASSCWRSSSR